MSGALLVAAPLTAAAGLGTTDAATSPGLAVQEYARPDTAGQLTVHWRGNGHGHGMSQYGAEGAALQGRSTAQILAFYYPGTTLTTIAPSTVRVRLSNAVTAQTTVLAATPGLRLSGYGALPARGYTQYRLVPAGSGLAVQGRQPKGWRTLRTGLASRADFSGSAGWVQVLDADGSSTRYRGTTGAVRVGSGEQTINRLPMDDYVMASVPREVPASWSAAAVHAQAIAARSYAEAVRSYDGGTGSTYDICDTTACQSYGGMAHYDSHGTLLWSEDPDAIAGNADTVLHYRGAPVFAQYSASNGGATVAGGQPYLIGRTDPYDTGASGDPYLDEEQHVGSASVAAALGLRSLTDIDVTRRDGNGPWGGRVLAATATGTDASGATVSHSVDGDTLGGALGVWTDYLRLDAGVAPAAAPTGVRARAGESGALLTWSAPGGPVTGYRVSFNGHARDLPATARSAWLSPISNTTPTTVWVQSVNAAGRGGTAHTSVQGIAVPRGLTALLPHRIVDTRTGGVTVDAAHPYTVALLGRGDLPRTAAAAQLSVTVLGASTAGVLRVAPVGDVTSSPSAIAYRPGALSTATVSVPLTRSGTVVFAPSAGSVQLLVDQQAYSSASGPRLTIVPRQRLAALTVPLGRGAVIDVPAPSGTSGAVVAIDTVSRTPGFLMIWPDLTGPPRVVHTVVGPGAAGVNTVLVRLGAAKRLRIASSVRGVQAHVVLEGLLGPAGATSGSRMVTVPSSPIARALPVGTSDVTLQLAGRGQVPASATGALVQLTVTRAAAAGQAWLWPAGLSAAPPWPAVSFAPGAATTSTALVRLGPSGQVKLRSSVPGAVLSVEVVGYTTG